jgi:hypothetical protein
MSKIGLDTTWAKSGAKPGAQGSGSLSGKTKLIYLHIDQTRAQAAKEQFFELFAHISKLVVVLLDQISNGGFHGSKR